MRELFLLRLYPSPRYRLKRRNGHAYAVITLVGLSALSAFARDKLCVLLTWCMLVAGVYQGYTERITDPVYWSVVILAPWFLYPLTHVALGFLLSHRKIAIMDANSLRYPYHFFERTISRDLPLAFELTDHIRSNWEKQHYDYRVKNDRQKGRARYRKGYFQESFHLVAISHHTSHILLTIYDQCQARKNLAVMNEVRERLDGERGVGKGVASAPEQEWRPRSGKLPD